MFDVCTKNFITVWVMLFTGRQTRWDVLTWDILTLRHFDSGTFWLGTFWLWDVLTWDFSLWDVLTWDFWFWGVLTWDILTLGRFDLGRFDCGTFWPVRSQKIFAISSLIKYCENILGTLWLTKNGTFWQITRDILVLGRFDLPTYDIWIFAFKR